MCKPSTLVRGEAMIPATAVAPNQERTIMRKTAMGCAMAMLLTVPTVWAAEGESSGSRVENVVVRADANFDFDRDTLKPEDQQKILAELGKAGKVAWQSVNAVGYTDSVGTVQYNQGLSERRARAVKAFLVSKGVSADMVATAGKAAADPVADNESDEGRAKNRRTAIEFQGVKSVDR
jgi:OmpA-OmpF porin, OOP family